MSLIDFAKRVPEFAALPHAQKVKHFGWYLHTEKSRDTFRVSEIRDCYDALHLDLPANLPRTVEALTEKKPPELLKKSGGLYRLHANARAALDARYGLPDQVIRVEKNLADLPKKLTNPSERLFLEETLNCYRHLAYRAAIVMAWNLAYDHLAHWVLSDPTRLLAFNQGVAPRFPKKAHVVIQQREDFETLSEHETIEVAAALPGITANMKKSLKEKLGRRNTYAHPSTMHAERQHVDEMILDLVHNIVLRLPWS